MGPQEPRRLYARSVSRAALRAAPLLVVAVLLGLAAGLLAEADVPPGYPLLGIIGAVAMVFVGAVTFAILRRCPECGCRSPVIKGSGGCCRRCGVRLVG
jgi:hypothetical protein